MKKGFTLIELLVVIAIIAILAAILFPVFAQAREKARASACLSNCKQIGTALQLYMDDYEEMVPAGVIYNSGGALPADNAGFPYWRFAEFDWYGNFGPLKWQTWMDAIFPYIKNANMFVCPSGLRNCAGYSVNTCLWGGAQFQCATAAQPVSLSQIQKPSDIVFCMDGFQSPNMALADGSTANAIHSGAEPLLVYHARKQTARHNNGCNVTYADGHAKWAQAESEVFRRDDTGTIIDFWSDQGANTSKYMGKHWKDW